MEAIHRPARSDIFKLQPLNSRQRQRIRDRFGPRRALSVHLARQTTDDSIGCEGIATDYGTRSGSLMGRRHLLIAFHC